MDKGKLCIVFEVERPSHWNILSKIIIQSIHWSTTMLFVEMVVTIFSVELWIAHWLNCICSCLICFGRNRVAVLHYVVDNKQLSDNKQLDLPVMRCDEWQVRDTDLFMLVDVSVCSTNSTWLVSSALKLRNGSFELYTNLVYVGTRCWMDEWNDFLSIIFMCVCVSGNGRFEGTNSSRIRLIERVEASWKSMFPRVVCWRYVMPLWLWRWISVKSPHIV